MHEFYLAKFYYINCLRLITDSAKYCWIYMIHFVLKAQSYLGSVDHIKVDTPVL